MVCVFASLNAQQCQTQNGLTFCYSGPDVIFTANGSCSMNFSFNQNAVTVTPGQDVGAVLPDAALTGYNVGDPVPAGTNIEVFFVIESGAPVPMRDTFSYQVSYADMNPPQFTYLPADTMVNCFSEIPATLFLTATDDCDPDFPQQIAPDNNVGGTTPCDGGMITRTWTATDASGNTTTHMRTITVAPDIQNPILTQFPQDESTICANADFAGWLAAQQATIENGASDNCNGITVTNNAPLNFTGCGAVTVLFTVSDACNQSTTTTATYTVSDDIAPGFTVPADTLVNCGTSTDPASTGQPTDLADNCTPVANLAMTFTDVVSPGTCPSESTIERTWTLNDGCGNVTSQLQMIEIRDTIAPDFTLPLDFVGSCSAAADTDLTGEPTGLTDNCDPSPSLTFTDNVTVTGCPNDQTIERVWTATDDCGNVRTKIQTLTLADTTPPTFTTQAQDEQGDCAIDVATAFQAWLDDHGGAVAQDDCSADVNWTVFETGTTDPPAISNLSCPSPDPGVLADVTVDFVATDDCGNSSTTTATFNVTDTEAPVLSNCPVDVTIPNLPGQCRGEFELQFPNVTDNCSENTVAVTGAASVGLDAPAGNPLETPVNPVTVEISVPGPPQTITGMVSLTVGLVNVDGEGSSEFFEVYGEDGTLIGTTDPTTDQCAGSQTVFSIPASTVQPWTTDGTITLSLQPNIPTALPGRFAINDICNGSLVEVEIDYQASTPDDLQFAFRIDGGDLIDTFPPQSQIIRQLDVGTHDIELFYTDCAGNQSGCAYQLTVVDDERPVLTCPADFTISTAPDSCSVSTQLPLPLSVTDNCGFPNANSVTQPTNFSEALLTFSYDPNQQVFYADEEVITFNNLIPNALLGAVELEITLQGDVNNIFSFDFFIVRNEEGDTLGLTGPFLGDVIPGDCTLPSKIFIDIPADEYNQYAMDGSTFFRFDNWGVTSAQNNPDFGINPCDPNAVTMDGDTDGTSFMTATLNYQIPVTTYYTTGATVIPPSGLGSFNMAPTHELAPGVTTVHWTVEDAAGNRDTCSYNITVEDTQSPELLCEPGNVFISTGGAVQDTIRPADVLVAVSDNCGLDTLFITPDLVACDRIGDTINVVLTAVDLSGNVTTCNTFVNIQGESPSPSYTVDCDQNSLQLFANPPATTGSNPYTFAWSGPNGYTSSAQNPILLNVDEQVAGFYTVTVTGLLDNCSSTESVEVPAAVLPPMQPLLSFGADSICNGQPVVLIVQGTGPDLTYRWYRGTPPNGTLIGLTDQPSFSYDFDFPEDDSYSFYVELVRNQDCTSPASVPRSVYVTVPGPTLLLEDEFVVCEGETVELEATLPAAGPGTNFSFTGPNLSQNSTQFKAILEDITTAEAGQYLVVGSRNGCAATPDTAVVFVNDRPEQPILFSNASGPNGTCEGQDLTLFTDQVPGANLYIWTKLGTGPTIETPTSQLQFSNAGAQQSGMWTVAVQFPNGCISEISEPLTINIEARPDIQIDADPEVLCAGATLQLNATSLPTNVNYAWSGPAGFNSIQQNPTRPNVTEAMEGIYSVVVTTPAGCQDSAQVTVLVNDPVTITAISNNAPDCPGGPVEVELVPTIFPTDDGSYTYYWTFMGDTISNQPVAVIPNADPGDNGVYQLSVVTADGCSSNLGSTVVELNPPVTTPAAPQADQTSYCQGSTLTLITTAYSGTVVYQWNTPNGVVETSNASLTITDVDEGDEGAYSVSVVANGCPSNESGDYNFSVNAQPAVSSFASPNPVCAGAPVQLNVVDCIPGATYNWQGPNGFTASVCNPTILQPTPGMHNGQYVVVATVNGCASEPDTLDLSVVPVPNEPALVAPAAVCVDAAEITLALVPGTEEPGASYTFYRVGTGALGAPQAGTSIVDPNSENYADGSVQRYYVVTTKNGCATPPSDTISVVVNTIPNNNAFAGTDQSLCEDVEQVFLNAEPPTTGTAAWSIVSGNGDDVVITNPDAPTTSVQGLAVGETYVFRWRLSNGACQNYSFDDVSITLNALEDAQAGVDIDTCGVETVMLLAENPSLGEGFWTQPTVQAALGISIDQPNDPNTTVSNLEDGNIYRFIWNIDGGCGEAQDSILVFVRETNPDPGNDFDDCGDGCTTLDATLTGNSSGVWTSDDPGVVIDDPTDPQTQVCNLREGENTFLWTLDDGRCGDASSATVTVTYRYRPEAIADEFISSFASVIDLDLLENDFVPEGSFVQLIDDPVNGTLERTGTGTYTYTPDINFIGEDVFTYELCLDNCDCSTATVRIDVRLESNECTPPTVLTPNSDGVNDFFVIPCLLDAQNFPDNTLSIFNEWGDEVYRAAPYRNDWSGTYNGDDLPPATYFFIFDNGDAVTDPVTGFFILQR